MKPDPNPFDKVAVRLDKQLERALIGISAALVIVGGVITLAVDTLWRRHSDPSRRG